MKKLMIVAAVALSAAFANAATVDWTVQAGKGLTTYIFNGDYASQLTTALGNKETGGTAAFNAFIATLTADTNYKTATTTNRGALGTFSPSPADTLTFLVFDSTVEDGKTYRYGTMSTNGFIYYPPPEGQQSSPGQVTFAYATGAGTSGTIAAQDVPEPTSAMLLLLGVAGLALRRRHA